MVKSDDIECEIKDIFRILIDNNKMIVNIIKDCSKDNSNRLKKAFKDNNIIDMIEEIEKNILNYLDSKESKKKDIKLFAKYLKINNDILKITKDTKLLLEKFNIYCNIKDNNINKYVISIYNNIIKIFKTLIEIIECTDNDEIGEIYDSIVILDAKIDSIYEDMVKYILKEKCKKDEYTDIFIMLRKTEKISSRALSIASIIRFGY